MTTGNQDRRPADESLEILFWWSGGDSAHPIEDGLENYLDDPPPAARRRRVPWPGRRRVS